MTVFERLGRLAAECDLLEVLKPDRGFALCAARLRDAQAECMEATTPYQSQNAWHMASLTEWRAQKSIRRGWFGGEA